MLNKPPKSVSEPNKYANNNLDNKERECIDIFIKLCSENDEKLIITRNILSNISNEILH